MLSHIRRREKSSSSYLCVTSTGQLRKGRWGWATNNGTEVVTIANLLTENADGLDRLLLNTIVAMRQLHSLLGAIVTIYYGWSQVADPCFLMEWNEMSTNCESRCRGSKNATPITGQKVVRTFVANSGLCNRLCPASDCSNVHCISDSWFLW